MHFRPQAISNDCWGRSRDQLPLQLRRYFRKGRIHSNAHSASARSSAMMTHLGNMQAAQQRTLPSPFEPSSEPECDTLPSDDFCLMLNSFDVNEQSKTDAHRLDRGEETDEISNDDGAVPEMPAFPSDLDAEENAEQALSGEAGLSSAKAGKIMAIDSGSSLASVASTAVVVPNMPSINAAEKAAQVAPKRRGRVSKRRKNAEERAAQIRARNCRAQQAFRKRQKVLSAERNDSLVKLEDEVSSLTEVNAKLEQRIEELQRELEHERRSQSRIALPQPLPLLPHHITPSFDTFFEGEHADMGLPSNFIF